MDDKHYLITFRILKQNLKSFTVRKKTKNRNCTYHVPLSIVKEMFMYEDYNEYTGSTKKMVKLLLPEWYVKKELGFYS